MSAVEPGGPLAGLTAADLTRFEQGLALFTRGFSPQEGLGPLFNEDRCSSCHDVPVTGGIGVETELKATRFVPPDSCDALAAQGGDVFQDRTTPLLRARGIERDTVPRTATGRARLIAPALFGLGLVEAIPDQTILAGQRAPDGRAGRTGAGRLGRFGFKADRATLVEFVESALRGELGLTTPGHPTEERPNGVPLPPGADPAPDPEMTDEQVALLADFVRFLAPPPPVVSATRAERDSVRRGGVTFRDLGCAGCHLPELLTGPSATPALDGKVVPLYSDLLLHDMGSALADLCTAGAKPPEVRTARLMGLRYRDRFLHDGRGLTIEDAILQHGGEARAARDRFAQLDLASQRYVLKFLATL